jgi:hypothetical protein
VAREVKYQSNPWGAIADGGGEEAQRTDLWMVDLSSPIRGVQSQLNLVLPDIPSYFAQSVSFPELRVKADQFRRDSRPYNMPAFDDPPDPVKITFILDARGDDKSSRIYTVLDKWRAIVRAGRGGMSEELGVFLNNNYRIDFAFNINVFLLKGGSAKVISAALSNQQLANQQAAAVTRQTNTFTLRRSFTSLSQFQTPTSNQQAQQQQAIVNQQAAAAAANAALLNTVDGDSINNDLQIAGAYTLKNAWLGGFKISDLNYGPAQIATIDAQFYVEDVFDQNEDLSFLQ